MNPTFPAVECPLPTLLLLVPLALGACSEGSAPSATVRDSGGVAIVENGALAEDAAAAGWTIEPSPAVVVGRVEGPEEYQLHQVRTARRLADGGLLVVNSGTDELRLYDPEGRHLRTLGREGEGPGEFLFPWDAWPWRGDSILAFDINLRRITVFDSAGRVGRTFGVMVAEGIDVPVAVLPGGGLITSTSTRGAEMHDVIVFHRDPRGAIRDTVGRFPDRRFHPIQVDEGRIMLGEAIFSPRAEVAAGDGRVFVARGREPEILVYDPEGNLLRRIHWEEGDRRVEEEDVRRYAEEVTAGIAEEEARQERRERMLDWPRAERFPTTRGLLVDAAGHLWAEVYPRPGEPEGRWRVFDEEGAFVGVVAMPDGLSPTEISRDGVLGIAEDELGVQRVRLHRLERGGR